MATEQAQALSDNSVAFNVPPKKKPFFVELPGLWKAMILTSFVMNIIFLFVIFLVLFFAVWYRDSLFGVTGGLQGFAKGNVAELRDVVDGLQAATIRTTIPLNEPLPLRGSGVVVPVDQETDVILTEPVPLVLEGAFIDLGNGNQLRANNINLSLPQGTRLRIALKMNIPLDDVTIPVKLNVPVSIPLKDTELGPQFERLGNVVDRLVYPVAPLLDLEIPEPPPLQGPK